MFMKAKIKVLLTSKKKPPKKSPKGSIRIEDFIEKEVPSMYEFIYGIGEEDIINQVDKHRPEIILITQGVTMDDLELLKKIKQHHPLSIVFMLLLNMIDDEQETIDEYMAYGAYKCFLQPLMIETLVHDMYVALNLEESNG